MYKADIQFPKSIIKNKSDPNLTFIKNEQATSHKQKNKVQQAKISEPFFPNKLPKKYKTIKTINN